MEDRIEQLKPRKLDSGESGTGKNLVDPGKNGARDANISTLPTLPALTRRLEADLDVFVGDENRALARGVCSMIIMQLANDLPYTGVDIWGAVLDCGSQNGRTFSDYDEDCAADGFSIISDVVNLATDFLVILAACKDKFAATWTKDTLIKALLYREGLGIGRPVRKERVLISELNPLTSCGHLFSGFNSTAATPQILLVKLQVFAFFILFFWCFIAHVLVGRGGDSMHCGLHGHRIEPFCRGGLGLYGGPFMQPSARGA